MRAEHALEERLVTPNPQATPGVHVVASPGSHAALEVGEVTVHSFAGTTYFTTYFTLYARAKQESKQQPTRRARTERRRTQRHECSRNSAR